MNKKIKAVIFDLDGVLVDATEWHYESLNQALHLFGYNIDREAHVDRYNGLPTRKKLEMLKEERGFPLALKEFVNKIKQKYTQDVIYNKCKPCFEKEYMLSKLKEEGYRIACCSNSVRNSVKTFLTKSGIIDYFEFYIGNDEGHTPKPDPAMYDYAINKMGLNPDEVVIVEDAPHGIASAKASGAHTCEVKGFHDVHYERLKNFIDKIEGVQNA